MPVRNALPYLDEAVESILAQTYRDFEFVILDDFSHDGSRERLRTWATKDSRIRLYESDERLGPAGSANRVVEEARADLVARMDADDVAHPERVQRQVEIMLRHPEVVLTASTWEGIDRLGKLVREADISKLSSNSFGPPMAHGSIMFRREAFTRVGGYDEECEYWEDLDFVVRLADVGRILVSAEPLYRHRFSETSTRLTSDRETVEDAVDFMFRSRDAYECGQGRPMRLPAPGTGTAMPADLPLDWLDRSMGWCAARDAAETPRARRTEGKSPDAEGPHMGGLGRIESPFTPVADAKDATVA